MQIATVTISVLAVIFTALGVFLPGWARRNDTLLKQAILSLERAYESLTDKGQHIAGPRADRLNWLTAARHIEDYKKIKNMISFSRSHKLLCEGQEEYWRHQFYLCLNKPSNLPGGYFEYQDNGRRNRIQDVSAIIIHDFAEWPQGKADPLDTVDAVEILEKNPIILKRSISLNAYLRTLPDWKDKIE